MTTHPRGLHHAPRNKALGLALALALGATACMGVQAAQTGHARVASLPGEPLNIEVPLLGLTADEIATLQVQLADAASWQRAGLTPPAPLADTHVTLEGKAADRRMVRISAAQPITTPTVDVLLNLRSSAGQRQFQVTLLVPERDAAAGIRRAAVREPQAAAAGARPQRVDHITVRPGQALWGIASRHAVADATIYQMLIALWQANPQAFIQGNMNLVRAGQTLTIPDAATVRAVDPAEARRIFAEQAEAYARYRGRPGAASGAAVVRPGEASSGQLESARNGQAAGQPPAQDRLKLSNAQGAADAEGDARTSDQRAMNDAHERVQTLQSNVDALQREAAGQGGNAQGAGDGAASGGASGANGTSGTSAAGTPGQASGGAAGAADAAHANGTNPSNGAAAAGGAGGVQRAQGTEGGQGTQGAQGASGPQAGAGGPAGGPSVGAAPAATPGNTSNTASGASNNTPAGASQPSEQNKDDMPSWLADNLLVVVTAILALLIFIVAWLLRRAGARRSEDVEAVDYSDPPPFDSRAFSRKLDAIDLDLNTPPTDEPPRGKTRA